MSWLGLGQLGDECLSMNEKRSDRGIELASAISVAIIATSAKMYRMKLSQRGRKARQASAKLSPETVPSLMQRIWRKMAKILARRTIKRSLNW